MNKLHTPALIAQRAEIQEIYAAACEMDRNQSSRMSGTVHAYEREERESLWDQYRELTEAYSVARATALQE